MPNIVRWCIILTSSGSRTSDFIGRQREMAVLTAALDDASSGSGRIMMLAGEPGIGKTRIAQELAGLAEQRGAQVLWGWCYERDGAPPYWPWVQPIQSYVLSTVPDQLRAELGRGASEIADLIPEIREKLPDLEPPPALEPEQTRFRLFNSVSRFLKNLAQSRSLVLVLDDLHWADTPSLLLLEFLARQIAESRILVIGTYRDIALSSQNPLNETLAQLSRNPAFQRAVLGGLSKEDVGSFIRAAGGEDASKELINAVYAHTEGNPFFMSEVIGLLGDREYPGESTGAAAGLGLELPQGVTEVIGQRLNRLSEECVGVLTTAAVIGRQFDFRMLRILSQDVTEDQLLQLVDEALDAYLIQEIPGQSDVFEFSHSLVQQTLRERLSTSRRVRFHARIGEALETLYGDQPGDHISELAYHFAEAAPVTGSSKVVRYSLLAGEQALDSYAWEAALEYFRRGLTAKDVDLTGVQPAPDQIAANLLFGLGQAQLAIKQSIESKDAVTSFTRAFEQFASSGNVERAVAIAEVPLPLNAGYITGAAQLITRALDLVPADSLQAGRLNASYGRIKGLEEGNYEVASQALNSSLEIARQNGDPNLELQALSYACDVDAYHLRLTEALEKGLRVVELAGRIDNPAAELMSRYWCFFISLSTDAPNVAAEHAAAMQPLWERLRHPHFGSRALQAASAAARLVGEFNSAREFSDQGLAAAPKDPRLLGSRLTLEYDLGNFEEGDAFLFRFMEVARQSVPGPNSERALLSTAIPAVMRITGVADHARIAEQNIRAILNSTTATPGNTAFAKIGSALLSVFRRDAVTAAENYTELSESPGVGFGSLSGFPAGRLLGLLSSTTGRLEEAATHFEDSLAYCRLGGFRPALAWTCHDYAEALLYPLTGSGRNVDETLVKVASLLNEALSISSDLGMRPLMERVAALQVLAADRVQLQPAYPGGLTEREVEVLTHLAQGKTNREIARELVLSERTVQRHISNIYAKIQVRNRAEATTFALSHLPL